MSQPKGSVAALEKARKARAARTGKNASQPAAQAPAVQQQAGTQVRQMKDVKVFLGNKIEEVARALPSTMDADRFLRTVETYARKNPKVYNEETDLRSFIGAFIEAAQLGLEPGVLSHLVPRWDKKLKRNVIQLMPDYRGLLALARRSEKIDVIEAHCVYTGDTFEYAYGTDPFLTHIRGGENKPGQITHVYALARYISSGHSQFVVISRAEIEEIRGSSSASAQGFSPWSTHYDQMAAKSALRRLCKQLPMSIEAQRAVKLDDLLDAGIEQDNGGWIEGELESE